jgi:3(or 17)beta-hydroxysteroid dehydrogenase
MNKSGSGSIINMASIAAIQGERYVVAYCAAKAAISGLTRATAVHCAQEKYNIRANCIAPSGMDTPMVQDFGAQMAEAGLVSGNEAASPAGQADDIGYMALYLASDESRFVSGTTMVVDNSMTITTGSVPQ